jgi:hypothetical protein
MQPVGGARQGFRCVLYGLEVWIWLRRLYVISGPVYDESERVNRAALTVVHDDEFA